MDAALGRHERERLRSERNYLRIIVLVLALGCLSLTGTTFYALTSQMTFLLPAGAQKPYALGRGFADKEYVVSFAYDVLSLWGNVTPENIAFNKERLLRLADSQGNTAIRVELDASERRIKQELISTVWSPIDAEVNLERRTVVCRGFLRTYINNVPTSNAEKRLLLEYHISQSGQAYVRNLREIKDKDATHP